MKSRIVQFFLILFAAYVSNVYTFAVAGNIRSKKPLASYQVNVETGWNLLSVPLNVTDGSKEVLYPTAASPAYLYLDSYVAKETLETGLGYWMKFTSPQTIIIQGDTGSWDVPIGPDFSFSTAILDVGHPFGMYLEFTALYSNTGSPAKLTIELGLDQMTTSMTSSYSLAAGSKPGSYDTNTGEISWNEITPLYPPDPNGAR